MHLGIVNQVNRETALIITGLSNFIHLTPIVQGELGQHIPTFVNRETVHQELIRPVFLTCCIQALFFISDPDVNLIAVIEQIPFRLRRRRRRSIQSVGW